jgi:hypothetical protein
MPQVGFEPTILVFERPNAVHQTQEVAVYNNASMALNDDLLYRNVPPKHRTRYINVTGKAFYRGPLGYDNVFPSPGRGW